MADTSEKSWIVDLVTIQMQDREDCTICEWVEELCAVPTGSEWTSLGFSVTDHCQSNKIRVVIDSSKGMRYRVTELSTLMDTAGGFGGGVTANTTGEGK